jgi:hypothetical protein
LNRLKEEDIRSNRQRLDLARQKLAQLVDEAEDLELCGEISIRIPVLRGRMGKPKKILADHGCD